MSSAERRDASSSATAVFPDAVGPRSASTKWLLMPRLWCLASRPAADTRPVKLRRRFSKHDHFSVRPHELYGFVALGALLSAAAIVGVAWAAGFGAVAERMRHVDAVWLPVALAAEALAYVGYVLAYREVTRVEDGPSFPHRRALARGATGFGVFAARGGSSSDLHALRQRACMGHFPPVAPLLVGYATGYALTRRTLRLAGAGAVEALLPFALLWPGTPLAAAVMAVLAYRIINFWLPIVPAVFGLRAL